MSAAIAKGPSEQGALIWRGVLGAPLAWMVQLISGWLLTELRCVRAHMRHGKMMMRLAFVGASLAIVIAATGCSRTEALPASMRGLGHPDRGELLIERYGCGRCHTIPGVRAANGVVGPPLFFFSRRTYIAGELPNTPDNLIRWIRDPQSVEPGTAMPRLGVGEQQARDIAAFLYTLR